MKYLLPVVAIMTLVTGTLAGAACSSAPHNVNSQASSPPVSDAGTRPVSIPTAASTTVATVSQQAAVRWAVAQAGAYGEPAPILKEVTLASFSEQLRRLNALGTGLEWRPTDIVAGDAPVRLVEMTGSFRPLHMPASVGGVTPFSAEPGVMFVLIDGVTGQKTGSGYVPDK